MTLHPLVLAAADSAGSIVLAASIVLNFILLWAFWQLHRNYWAMVEIARQANATTLEANASARVALAMARGEEITPSDLPAAPDS